MTQTHRTQTIAIEAMQTGHRYLHTVSPDFHDGWTVASVDRRLADIQVWRGGEWIAPQLVTVTYNNGCSITHEAGTDIAIDCDER